MERRLIAALILMFISVAAEAKTKIWLIYNADTLLGRQLVFTLKEAIRGSQSFELSDDYSQSDLTVRFGVLDATEVLTSWATVFVWKGFFVSDAMGTCGQNVMPKCVLGILADMDSATDYLNNVLKKAAPAK